MLKSELFTAAFTIFLCNCIPLLNKELRQADLEQLYKLFSKDSQKAVVPNTMPVIRRLQLIKRLLKGMGIARCGQFIKEETCSEDGLGLGRELIIPFRYTKNGVETDITSHVNFYRIYEVNPNLRKPDEYLFIFFAPEKLVDLENMTAMFELYAYFAKRCNVHQSPKLIFLEGNDAMRHYIEMNRIKVTSQLNTKTLRGLYLVKNRNGSLTSKPLKFLKSKGLLIKNLDLVMAEKLFCSVN